MNKPNNKKHLFYLLFTFILSISFISSCVAASATHKLAKGKPMNTSEWKTHTFGRMQIDLPPNAIITKQEHSIRGVKIIWREDLDLKSLEKEIDNKIKYYKSVKPDEDSPPPSMFIRQLNLYNNGIGLHHWDKMDLGGYSGDVSIIDCYFITNDLKKIFYYEYPVGVSRFESGVKRMIDFSKTIVNREKDEIPSEPGFCFPGGFSKDQEVLRREKAAIQITLPDYPDTKLVYIFETAGFQKEDSSAMKEIKTLSRQYPGKVLRLGRYSLPGRPRKGREMCTRIKNEYTNGNEYRCMLAFDSERPLNQPEIYVSITTEGMRKVGHYKGPQVFADDTEALELWDALIKTIRPYPGSA